jgi:hypothetical protein
MTAFLLLLATVLALGACGSSRHPGGTAPDAGLGSHSQAVEFANCMRSHGLSNFPDPNPGGFSFPTVPGIESAPAFRAAQQACERFLPTGPSGPPMSSTQAARMQQDALATATCMRAHGVPNFPDPTIITGPDGSLQAISFSGSIWALDLQSPAYRAAEKICPQGLGGNFTLTDIAARQKYGCRCVGDEAVKP